MDTADQQRAAIAGLPIGNSMVVSTTATDRRPRGRNLRKPKLRSQNVELALVAMPTLVRRSPETIVSFLKRIVSGIHRTLLTTRERHQGIDILRFRVLKDIFRLPVTPLSDRVWVALRFFAIT
jgi:hypothetical protein